MSTDLIIALLVGLAAGAGATYVVSRTREQAAASRAEEARAALATERTKTESLQGEIRDAIAAKSRMEGEITGLTKLREDLETRDEELKSYVQRMTSLSGEVERLKKAVEAAEQAKLDAIADSKLHAEQRLAQMEEDVQRRIALIKQNADQTVIEKEEAVRRLIEEKDRSLADKRKLLEDAERALVEKFNAASFESLKKAQEEFLKLAGEKFEKSDESAKADLDKRRREIENLLKPLGETLDKLERGHKEMEERRVSAFDQIQVGLKNLSQETDQLANALRKPNTRGAWGEMQLQVILENAGMHEGEHFVLQHSTEGEDGRLRTDVVIRLPKGRVLVIDSKAPLESYWDGMNAPDEATRTANFAAHARLVRDHVKKLSGKQYWSRYAASPDCVVMFVPTEGAYQAAFESDRALLSDAHAANVYIANPMTLISMVHIAAYILREERVSQQADQVRAYGTELYKRLGKFLGDLDKLGSHLKMAVGDYNRAVGSIEGRVLPAARDMAKLGAGTNEPLPTPTEIEEAPRPLKKLPAPEFSEPLSLDL